MTLPTFPVNAVRQVSRRLARPAAVTSSPFSGVQNVQDWGGAWWEYEIEMAVVDADDGRALSVFFDALGGPVGKFLFADPSIVNPTGLGTPLVDGAGQTGTSLDTDGWSAGLRAGDFFSIGTDDPTRLYRVSADVVPSSGAATVNFFPALRSSPADNAALNVLSPTVMLRLTSPVPSVVQVGHLYQFSFTAREAL